METIIQTHQLCKSYKGAETISNVNMNIKKRRDLWFFRSKWCWENNGYENDFKPGKANLRSNKDF